MTERTARLRAVAPDADPSSTLSATVRVTIDGEPVLVTFELPSAEVCLHELVPAIHGLTDLMTELASEGVAREGRSVSCRAGCGACCRQPVPVTESEAIRLAALVDEMPEPRRTEVRARFAAALARLGAAGMLGRLRRPEEIEVGDPLGVGREYFELGVPCPFLEAESCSIHPERPIACREFLVTSDPIHCQVPRGDMVRRVPLPASVFRAARAMDARSNTSSGWTTLILALEHAGEARPAAARQSLTWLHELLAEIGKPKQPSHPHAV